MSRLKTMGFAALVLSVAGACIGLGRWQLRRLAERRAHNLEVLRAREAPPVNLNDEPPAGNRIAAEELVYRRVSTAGTYDHSRAIVLRGRVFQGTPGVYLVTPLILAGKDTAVLVNRGFVPAADAFHIDHTELDRPASTTVTGVAILIPVLPDEEGAVPIVSDGDTTWRRLERRAVTSRFPYPVLPVVIMADPSSDSTGSGYPLGLGPEPITDGPHLSYAIQWFSFAAIALIGGGLWLRRAPGRT